MWQEPVFHRTAHSFLEAADLNRIEGNILFLGRQKKLSLDCKTDWNRYQFHTQADFERICHNTDILQSVYGKPISAPELPSPPFLYFSKINDIEYILYLIFKKYKEMQAAKSYTGEIYSGNKTGVI